MLKYLFRCQFNDGETFIQTQADVSKHIEGKSAFTDVLKKVEDGNQIKYFSLNSRDDTYLVDLDNGCFAVNGIPFFMHEQTVDKSKKLTNFRLIYFRRVAQSINLTTDKQTSNIIYLMGWQANYPDGSNHKQIMYIK